MKNPNKIIYWTILVGMVIFAAILEFTDALTGLLANTPQVEFWTQCALVLITLVAVYAALKLIKKDPIVRMAILEIPALANLICYHLFQNASFGYLVIICLLAYVFVYPAQVSNNENENENKDEKQN